NTFLLQIIIDFEELQQRLRDGTSEFCCFDNHNVLVENAVFQNSQDAVTVAGRLFDEGKFRVFLVNSFSSSARKIICEVHYKLFGLLTLTMTCRKGG
ncbi:hypothetical protein GBAR_LOCUS11627, partial [Geodia barretti]